MEQFENMTIRRFENEKTYPHENFFSGEYLPSLLPYGQSCVIAPFMISFVIAPFLFSFITYNL